MAPTSTPSASLRVFSAVGPGDVVGAYDDWAAGIRTSTETSLTFSGQLLDFLASARADFWLVSSHPNRTSKQVGGSIVENRPKPMPASAGGLRFHWGALRYAVSLAASARRFKATHAVIDSGTTHWFALVLLRLFRIEVIPNLHNVYWPMGHPPTRRVARIVLYLDSLFFRLGVRTAMGVSTECGAQVGQMSCSACRFIEYRAQFHAADVENIAQPQVPAGDVHVLFAGRVEESKGALDLVEVCRQLIQKTRARCVFEVCGNGGAFDALQARVVESGLSEHFRLHGKLKRVELLEVYRRAHFVIVPTRSTFCEGLPMVCAEAVLAGRPVVTSRLSNAVDALDGAVIEAKEDDPADYARVIAKCLDDPASYVRLVAGCATVSRQFIDRNHGFTAALAQAFRVRLQ